ncbi:MAG: hypothetical protein H7144_03785 [Burkholderiales bacterium]|nr:hypothetical protein [Phycisphaerae bacterium]
MSRNKQGRPVGGSAVKPTIEPLERRRLLAASPTPGAQVSAAPVGVPPRIVENLGRGVVAVRTSSTQALVTWRLLALDPVGIGFNVYRSANGAAAVKLNGSVLTAGTNYTDTNPNLTLNNTYHVRPVINGVEQPASGTFLLKANNATEPVVRIPITPPPQGYRSKSIWVGDLDGDGEFDFVVDRLAPFYVDPVTGVENNDIGTGNQFLEAFTSKGVKLWTIDMGPTSRGTYNISPGAATISMGMWDGVTVQDLNGDGKAEIVLKIANGVKFPDGTTFTTTNDQRQFISVLNGMTGNKLAHLEFPSDHAFAGRLASMLGVGYLNGGKASIVGWLRNRNPDTSAYGAQRKQFNDIMMAWDWNGGSTITQRWKLPLKAGDPAAAGISGFHQMRIIDVNGDGSDDLLPGNYAINGKTGAIIYKLAGIGHGDRFHVGDFDPDRPGLEGFGIQQNDGKIGTANAILDYYYDADDGTILWTNNGVGYDVGRGAAGDVDPSKRGYEVWSFEGMYNGPTKALVDDNSNDGIPWPNLRIWWDGDLGSEEMDGTVINKYNPVSKTTGRLVTGYKLGATTNENFPGIYGDILGDWREEGVYMNSTWSEFTILTTNVPTTTRLYTLSQNAAYRNSLTVKGYYQSNHVDYYLGYGMTTPPTPNVVYADTVPPTIVSSVFNYATSQSLAVTFSESVSPSILTSSNFAVLNQTTGLNVPAGQVAVAFNTATNVATITYTGVLADGNYRVTFNNVTDAAGKLISGTNFVDFFVLAADANHDRFVDAADQSIVTANLNQSGKNFSQGDFDYNGTVNSLDQTILTNAMRLWLPAIGALAVPATSNADLVTLKRESAALVDLYTPASATPISRIYIGGLTGMSFSGGSGDDTLTLDYSNGIPFVGATFAYDGGLGTDTLAIVGGVGAETATFAAASVAISGSTVTDTTTEARRFDGKQGLDNLTVTGGPSVEFPATQSFNVLTLAGGSANVRRGSASLVKTKTLSISGAALLDLHDNNLLVDYTAGSSPYTAIFNWVKTGLVLLGGSGQGIGSSEVDAQTPVATRLAVVDNAIAAGQIASISGFVPPAKSILVKYTWAGDANLDGAVNGSDYALADNGYSSAGLSSWFYGDFDYDGITTGSDYALADTGFSSQTGVLI